MNVYLILTVILVGLIGAIIGMVGQSFIDNDEYRALESAYLTLKKKNEQLETENTLLTGEISPERIEVIHKHVFENHIKTDVDYSQNW